ncbi:DUF6751 family protein [Holdemania massiliensis]|uniref:DUF6751 family protein n=1 Tax=Holdemania massiliensis TaxID=1468449 RepID=UPI001F06049F|nr:DUF6751 family protein [Holdemania massiliensis]MCH1940025.1 hypothetical protein [Holdemania massiliensis]
MFPHTITVYRHQDDDSYSRTVIHGVYWYGSRSRTKSNKGVDQDAAVTVIIPFLDADVQPGDLIVKSEWKTVRSKAELEDVKEWITAESVSEHDVGSELDGITVKGS